MAHQIVFRVSPRSIGLIGLCITVIGLFLPWLEVQYYYYPLLEEVRAVTSYIYPPYYSTYYELGVLGIGWNTVLASLLAAYALFTDTKRRPGLLAVSSLAIFYNVGSVLAMYYLFTNYYYYYYYTALGVGLFVCLIGGIFFLIAALLDLSHATGKVTYCKKCGSSLLDSYQFCPYCGENIAT